MPPDIVGDAIATDQLYDAVNLILSLQVQLYYVLPFQVRTVLNEYQRTLKQV
jgi:hypothetical protein